jgi:hypothetical protein
MASTAARTVRGLLFPVGQKRPRRTRVWLPALACIALSQGGADGATLRNKFHVTSWSGGAYFDNGNKTFERCRATKSGPEGVELSFSVDRDLHWRVTLSNPAWAFVQGAKQYVNLTIGDPPTYLDASVAAIDRSELELHVADAVGLFAKLRIAPKMRLVIGGLVLDIPMDGGEQVLSALTKCVLRSAHHLSGGKSDAGLGAAPQGSSKAIQTEAAALAANIIAYARIPNSKPVPAPGELSGVPVDAAWKVDLITAGVTILEAPQPKEQIANVIAARGQKSCRDGFFYITATGEIDKIPIMRLFVSCETTETTNSSYHLIVPRPKGGHYIFTVSSTASAFIALPHRQADAYEERLRAVVTVAINKLP